MSRRKRRVGDLCKCGHEYRDHQWGFKEESEPCDIFGCLCLDWLADGVAPDPDRDDRAVHMAGCDGDRPEWRDQ